jgi:hypothetical protein
MGQLQWIKGWGWFDDESVIDGIKYHNYCERCKRLFWTKHAYQTMHSKYNLLCWMVTFWGHIWK